MPSEWPPLDWRLADGEIERSALWMYLKVGPMRNSHREECRCNWCCGPKLAAEIAAFYKEQTDAE